jgi:hypothetical protein
VWTPTARSAWTTPRPRPRRARRRPRPSPPRPKLRPIERQRKQAAADAAAREAQAKADADANAKAQAEADAKAKAAADLVAQQEAEADRRRREQAEAERAARERADAARLARDQAEAERLAREAAERTAAAAAVEAARREEKRRERRRRTIGVGAAAAAIALFAGVGFAAMGCLGRCGPGGSPLPSAGRSAVIPSTAIPSGRVEPSTGPPSTAPVNVLHDTRILFTSVPDGTPSDIWIAAPDRSVMEPLITSKGSQGDAFWAPTGTEFVYRGGAGLRIAPRDGKSSKPFTSKAQDTNPAWSPDGNTIAFASTRSSSNLELYTLPRSDPNGTPEPLASSGSDDWDPSWSKDSKAVAFVSRRDNATAIWVVNVNDPKHPTRLTKDNAIYDDPAFSPDGKWIAATRRANANVPKVLWLMKLDETGKALDGTPGKASDDERGRVDG